ncbi:phage baseplate assembly protein V [Streptomyces cucumeris]|uniref:phage baseplate assembly protein V n=1 Tax=Streptomyces cucumeris TaxID=2962890 RepID=UPI003D708AB5
MTAPVSMPRTRAVLRVGASSARPLADELQQRVLRTVVDSRLHMPTMVEVTFRDDDGDLLTRAGITFGTTIEVWTQDPDGTPPVLVGSGEVTALEGDYYDLALVTVVRGYDPSHRLQRGSRVRTFLNTTDADAARRIAREAGLTIGRVEPSRTTHTHLGQPNQTDWDFLSWRCREIGYRFGVDEDGFYFRPAAQETGTPVTLTLQENLRTFRPRVTAGNLPPEVELRVWDPLEARAVSVRTPTGGTADGPADALGTTVASVLAPFRGTGTPSAPRTGADPTLGPAPTTSGRIVTHCAPAAGAAIEPAAHEALTGATRRVAGSLAEAQATAWGDPRLRAGAAVRVEGPPEPFAGTWTVVAARHVFDPSEGGYRTRLQLGNGEDRTLLGLAGATAPTGPPRMNGLVCGVVTDVNDPTGKSRIKAVLPWLAPDHETDWAPVVQVAGGRRAGGLMLPEVGDQVLLGFELGDPRRPYVVGGVLSNSSAYALGGPAVETTGRSAEVVRRGIVSPAGNMLAFHDRIPPAAGQPPTASAIVLGTKDARLGLTIDQVAGTVTLTCRPQPPDSKGAGRLHIDCGDGGAVDITAGTGGRVSIDGGSSLSLRAQSSITLESSGTVAIKGAKIELN